MPAATSHVPLLPRSSGRGEKKASTAAKKSAASIAEDEIATKDVAASAERTAAALPTTTTKEVPAPSMGVSPDGSAVEGGAASAQPAMAELESAVSGSCCKAKQDFSTAAFVGAEAAAAHPVGGAEQQVAAEAPAGTTADTLAHSGVTAEAEAAPRAGAEGEHTAEAAAAAAITAVRCSAKLDVLSPAAEKEASARAAADAAAARRAAVIRGPRGNEGIGKGMQSVEEPAAEASASRGVVGVDMCAGAAGKKEMEFAEADQLQNTSPHLVPVPGAATDKRHSSLRTNQMNDTMPVTADGRPASEGRQSAAEAVSQEAAISRRETPVAAGQKDEDRSANAEEAAVAGAAAQTTAVAETTDDQAAAIEREAEGPSERLSPFLDGALREQLERRGLMPCSLADVLRRRKKEWARTQVISAEVQPEKERLDSLFKRQCEGWGNNQEGWIHGRWCSVIFCPDFRQGGLQVSRTGRRKLWDRLKQTVEGWVDPRMQICEVLDSTHPVRFATPPDQSCYTVVYVGEPVPANKQSRIVFGEYTGAVLRNSAARKSFEYVFDLSFCALAWRKAEEFETASDSSDDEVPFSGSHYSLDDDDISAVDGRKPQAAAAGGDLLRDELEAVPQQQPSREKKKQLVAASGTIELLGDRVERRNTEWQQVFVDGWPHIVLTSIPGVGIRRGDELLADFGNEWFHKVQDAAHAQIAQELLRYRLRIPPPQPPPSAAAPPPPRLFPDRPFSCIDRRADPLLRNRARRGEICPYCHCDEVPQQQEDLDEQQEVTSSSVSPQQQRPLQEQPSSPQQQQQHQSEQASPSQQQQQQREEEEPQERQQQQLFGDEVVHCDGCDRPCHLRCLPDGAATLNEWKWYCAICRMQFFEMARNMDYRVLVPAQEVQAEVAAAAHGTHPVCCDNNSSGSSKASRDAPGSPTAGPAAAAARGGAAAGAAAGAGGGLATAAGAVGGGGGEARRVVGHLQRLQQKGPREGGSSSTSTGSTTTPSVQEEEATDNIAAAATSSPQNICKETGAQQQTYEGQKLQRGRENEATVARQQKESLKKPAAFAAAAGGSCSNSSNTARHEEANLKLLQQQQQQHGNHPPSARCSPRLMQQPVRRSNSTSNSTTSSNSSSNSSSSNDRGSSGRRLTPENAEKEKRQLPAAERGNAAASYPSKRYQHQMSASSAAATAADPSRMHTDDAACGDRSSKTDGERCNSKPGTADRASSCSSSCSTAADGGDLKTIGSIKKEWSHSIKAERKGEVGGGGGNNDSAKQQQENSTKMELSRGRQAEDQATAAGERCFEEKRVTEAGNTESITAAAVAGGGFPSQAESEAAAAAAAAILGESFVAAAADDAGSNSSSRKEPAGGETAAADTAERPSTATAGERAQTGGSRRGTAAAAAATRACVSSACEKDKEAAAGGRGKGGGSPIDEMRQKKMAALTDAEAAALSWNRFARPPLNVSETRRVCEATGGDGCRAAGRMQASRAGLVGLHEAELQGLQSHVPMPPRFLLGSLRPCMHCHRLLGARASTEVCRLTRRHLAPSWDHPHQAASPALLREAILTAFQEKLTSLQREMKSRMHALQKELRKARAAAGALSPAAAAGAGGGGVGGAAGERHDSSNSSGIHSSRYSSNVYAGQFLTAAAAEFLSSTQQNVDAYHPSDLWNSSSSKDGGKSSNSGSYKSGSTRAGGGHAPPQRISGPAATAAARTMSSSQQTWCSSPLPLQQWKKKRDLTEGTRQPVTSSLAAAVAQSDGHHHGSPAAAGGKATGGKTAASSSSSSFISDPVAAAANGHLLERLFHVPPVQKVGFVPLLGVYLGKTFVDRHFEQGWFAGRVVDYSPLTIEEDGRWYSNLFRIEYDDGDEEFFSAEDLLELLSTHAVRRWESCNSSSSSETDETHHPSGGAATAGGGGKHFYKTTTLDRLLAPGVKAARLELNARLRRLRMLEEAEGEGSKKAAAAANGGGVSVKTEQAGGQLKKRRREISSTGR